MAGSGNRDVALTISAKNQASAAVDSASQAFETLAGIMANVGEASENMDGLLGELKGQLAGLASQAKGLEALGVVAGSIDKAAAAVERLQNQAERSQGENETLGASYAQAALATKALAASAEQAKVALESQRAALVSLRAADKTNTVAINAQRTAVAEAAAAYKALQAQVRVAAANENSLDTALARSTAGLVKQQEALTAASAALGEIQTLAGGASAALGGVAATQEAVALASANTAAEIAKVNAAIADQPGAGAAGSAAGPAASATAAYRAQVEAVQQAKAAFTATSVEATRLGAALAKAEGPTQQLSRDFTLAKAASASAEAAYVNQSRALATLRGQGASTFGTFIKSAESIESTTAATMRASAGIRSLVSALPALAAAEEQAAAKSRGLSETLRALAGTLLTIPTASNEAAEEINRVSNAGHGSLNIFTRMRNELLALTTAYIGFYGAISAVGHVVETYQTLQSAQQRLAVAFEGDQRKVATEIGFVREQSERLGISFNTLVQQYTRIAIAGKEAGFSADGTRKIFLAFAEAARVAGLSEQQLDSAFLGLREGIERGTINARNFNLEIGQNVPGAVQAMAQALGVSTAKFTQLQKASGGVAANEDTLVKFADNLTARFKGELPAAVETLNAELGRFKTHMQEAELAVADGGFAAGLTSALKQLDAEFKDGSGDSFFRELGAAMGALAGIIPLVVNNFGLLVGAARVFIGLKIAEVVLSIVKSQTLFGISLAASAVKVDALSAATARLFTEQGILATGFTRLRVAAAQAKASLETMTVAEALAAVRCAGLAVGTTVLGAAMAGLRAVMITVTATAEAMWLAIGGFPGLIITGLTFLVTGLLGDWIGGIGKANDAMAEHADIMARVQQAYADANGDAVKLKENLKDITAIEIERDAAKQSKDLSDARTQADRENQPQGPTVRTAATDQLDKLVARFKAGTIAAAEFRRQLSDLARANPDLDRQIVYPLIDIAKKADEAEAALKRNGAALHLLAGTATDADRALLGLGHSAEAVNSAFDPSALDRYTKALLDLQKQIPGLAKFAEMQEKIAKVNDDFASAKLDLAGPLASKDAKVAAEAQADLAKLTAAKDGAIAQIQVVDALDRAQEGSGQPYVDTARKFTGDSATHGRAELEALFKSAGEGTALDKAWCAAFVNAVLKVNGAQGTGSLAAKSFLNYGTAVPNQDARPGDIVVIKNSDGSYHVGIYAGAAAGGRLDVIGGNQHGGKVNEESFSAASVAAIRRPPTPAEQQKSEDKAESSIDEFNRFVAALVDTLKGETAGLKLSPRDAFIATKLDEIQKRVDQSGPTAENPTAVKQVFTAQQQSAVAAAAGSEFDAKQQIEDQKKLAAAQLELDQILRGDKQALTREEYIHNEAIKDGVSLLDGQNQKYAEIKGRIYDLTTQQKAFNDAVGLGQQVKSLGSQLKAAFKDDPAAVPALQKELAAVVVQLKAALPAAQAFAAALGDSKMTAQLDKLNGELRNLKVGLTDANEIDLSLADGFTKAIDASIDGYTKYRNVLTAVAVAFRQFAADFIRQTADMILKQQILALLQKSGIGGKISGGVNSLANAGQQAGAAASATTISTAMTTAGVTAGTTIATQFEAAGTAVATQIAAAMAAGSATGGGGGGLGSLFSGLFSGGGDAAAAGASAGGDDIFSTLFSTLFAAFHGGGIVGVGTPMTRAVSPLVFAGAARFHDGGFPGLGSNEVAAVLQKGEEVLTSSDARHSFNQRGAAGQPQQAPQVKVVAAISPEDILREGLASVVGQNVVIAHLRTNKGAVKSALGIPGR